MRLEGVNKSHGVEVITFSVLNEGDVYVVNCSHGCVGWSYWNKMILTAGRRHCSDTTTACLALAVLQLSLSE